MVRFFLVICFLYFHPIYAQDIIYVEECDEIEIGFQPPEFYPIYRIEKNEGDIFSLQTLLSDSIDCPLENCDSISSSRVVIQFIVQKNGEISDIKIVKGINREIDKAAVRVINRLECIKPAITRNKPIQFKEVISVKINFKNAKTQSSFWAFLHFTVWQHFSERNL